MSKTLEKRLLSIVLILCMVLATVPVTAVPVRAATTDSMNALDALGIDSSNAPDGFDPYSTSNPYGKNSVTINPVSELMETIGGTGYLYGHNTTKSTVSDIIAAPSSAGYSTPLPSLASVGYAASAAGNFTGATDGTKAQIAYVGIPRTQTYSVLYFGDASKNGLSESPSNAISLEGTYGASHLYQRLLQVTTGDYDGDGYDEVAVFVPQHGDYHVRIYKLLVTSNPAEDAWMTATNWKLTWSYALSGSEFDYFTLVSLMSGDCNRDGIDDLIISYGKESMYSVLASRIVILAGDAGENMLHNVTELPLSFEGKGIYGASAIFGDITGSGESSLIVGGRVLSATANNANTESVTRPMENVNSRYVAVYDFVGRDENGKDIYRLSLEQNFNLFEKDSEGNLIHAAMSGGPVSNDVFFSLPGETANMAVIGRGLSEAPQLYFDSLLFEVDNGALTLVERLDITPMMQRGQPTNFGFYMEYGAISGDMTGQGYDTLALGQIFLQDWIWTRQASIGNYKSFLTQTDVTKLESAVTALGSKLHAPSTPQWYRVLWDSLNDGAYYQSKSAGTLNQTAGVPFTLCFMNTDQDTTYLKYTGEHYYLYTDPKVLAAIAAPPAFGDLLERSDLSGNYAESTTSYASSTGSGSGSTSSHTFKLGAFVSYDKPIMVMGLQVARIVSETELTGGCTWEYESMSTLTQSVQYSTTAGRDAVAFYSIPLEIYAYDAYTPKADGSGYEKTTMTISIPHNASVRVLELEEYERIAADYAELPQLVGTVFTHDPYDPSTYPVSAPGNATVYSGDWASTGYTGVAGGTSLTQTLASETEDTALFTSNLDFETRIGAGMKALAIGITGGYSYSTGSIEVTMTGEEFSGQLQSMPIEAQEYGYAYNWKLFGYTAKVGGNSFPVVNYLVSDVMCPPSLPADFGQDMSRTTDEQVCLTWSTDKLVAGYQLYRYYEFPEGSGSYDLAFLPMSEGELRSDGRWHFSYVDENLDPYTEYEYQIQTVKAAVPNRSITSEFITMRTKAATGYPDTTLTGDTSNWDSDAGTLYIYPDADSSISVVINNASDYKQAINYQWQKNDNGLWRNLDGKTGNDLIFRSSGLASEGEYRCRLNVIYDAKLITAYSDTFRVQYNMRVPVVAEALKASVDQNGIPSATVSLKSIDPKHNALPSGYVTFEIKGMDYSRTYTVPLSTAGLVSTASLASMTADKLSALPKGAYTMTARYSGSRVFRSLTDLGSVSILSGGEGWLIEMTDQYSAAEGFQSSSTQFTYGDTLYFKVSKVTQGAEAPVVTEGIYDEEGAFLSGTDLLQTESLTLVVTGKESLSGGLTAFTDKPFAGTGGVDWMLVIGDLSLTLKNGGVDLAALSVTISPRPITATVPSPEIERPASGSAEDPFADMGSYTLSDMGTRGKPWDGDGRLPSSLTGKFLYPEFYNSSGKTIARGNMKDALPGIYTMELKLFDTAAYNGLYRTPLFYNLTQQGGRITYTASRQALSLEVPTVKGAVPGKVSVVAPELKGANGDRFSGGATLVLLATPYSGYEVDRWDVYVTGNEQAPIHTQYGGTVLTYTTKAEDITIKTTFKTVGTTLTVTANPEAGGTFTLPPYFTNGAEVLTGAEYSFTTKANDGYTFSGWDYIVGGSANASLSGTANADGSNTVSVTMPGLSVRLVANFTRNSYTVTAGEGIQGSYSVLMPSGVTETVVFTGSRLLPGDTQVTFTPVPGRTVNDGAKWTVGGEETDAAAGSQSFVWRVTKNAAIDVATGARDYLLTVTQPANGKISVTVNGTAKTVPAEGLKVSSDSTLVFSLLPSYPYQAAAAETWRAGGTAVSSADGKESMTLNSLSGNTTVTVQLEKRAPVDFYMNTDGNGSLTYSLYDHAGRHQVTNTGARQLTLYVGDTIEVTATPANEGVMFKGWSIDGVYGDTGETTKTFLLGTERRDAIAYFASKQPGVKKTATFALSENDGSSSVTATVISSGGTYGIDSGAEVVLGSRIAFNAYPMSGKMVDYWTVNGKTAIVNGNQHLPRLYWDVEGDVNVVVHLKDEEKVTIKTEYDETKVKIDFDAEQDKVKGTAAGGTVTPLGDYALGRIYLKDGDTQYDLDSGRFFNLQAGTDGSLYLVYYATADNLTLVIETADEVQPPAKQDQTITWDQTLSAKVGDAAITLTAAASSKLDVVYSSGDASVATVSGSTLTIVGEGTTDITASQPGNDVYNAATSVVKSITVSAESRPATYGVTLHANGGSGFAALTEYAEGTGAALPTGGTKSGYTFVGWFDNEQLEGTAVTAITAADTGDKAFWAKWLSTDAGLVSVAGQNLVAAGTGSSGSPKTATMTVANSVAALAAGDIVCARGAASALYSDSAFTTAETSVALTEGTPVTAYIKVTAEDGETTLHYAVTVTRATAGQKTVAVGAQQGTVTAGAGGSVTYAVTVANIADETYSISVAGLPDGVTCPESITIASGEGTLTLQVADTAEAGTAQSLALTVDGAASGLFSLTITPPVVDAKTPEFTTNLSQEEIEYTVGGTAGALTVTATVTDGGDLSYQWYSKDTNDSVTPAKIGTNSPSFTPSTAAVGTTYYYVVVTNENTQATGSKTAVATSNTAKVTVKANAQEITITFNPGGGTVAEATRKVASGSPVGALPTASRGGHTLTGWFTEASGGSRITADTVPTGDVTYYAQWQSESSGGDPVTPPSGGTTGGGTAPATENKIVNSASWSGITQQAAALGDGKSITIDMNGSETVPAGFLQAIAGKNVTAVFTVDPTMSWAVSGKDVPVSGGAEGLNLGVSTGSDYIPAEVRSVDGSTESVQLRLSHNGEFGAALTLRMTFDKKNSGMYANLFFFDPEARALEFRHAAKISTGGVASFPFDHASDYLIVVAAQSLAPETWENPFGDVTQDDWFFDDVAYAAQKGLFTGTSASAFSPYTPMSRAMLVTVLWRLNGSPTTAEDKMHANFADVVQDSWYEIAVGWAARTEIVSGYGQGFFGPDDNVTREQFATILYRYAGSPELTDDKLEFADAQNVSNWARDAIIWATQEGIITGKPGNLLDPKGDATRAEAAAMLRRFLEK